ncbi:hypothetical protein DWUX_1877 [Desulfovibrio diazotrophicus]|nr:hypothetical protein DWUX_1877 [Desulfovibrio diazotrophicus]
MPSEYVAAHCRSLCDNALNLCNLFEYTFRAVIDGCVSLTSVFSVFLRSCQNKK